MSHCYLGCSKEDFLCNLSNGARRDAQAHAGEDVGVVSLTRVECPAIGQSDGVKRTAAGKDAPPLRHRVVSFTHFVGVMCGSQTRPRSECGTSVNV